jgi:Lar family restriction alleviation protein
MAEELKACPFCGGRELIMREAWRCWVRCCGCGAEGGYGDDEAEAAAKWNRRVLDVPGLGAVRLADDAQLEAGKREELGE